MNLPYGSSILIGAGCYFEAKGQLEVRPIEMVLIEEENVMTEVYELLDEKGQLGEADQKSRDLFWEGIIYFREGKYDLALEQFNAARLNGREALSGRSFQPTAAARIRQNPSIMPRVIQASAPPVSRTDRSTLWIACRA